MSQLSKILFKSKPTIDAYKKGLEKHKKETRKLFQTFTSVGQVGVNQMAKKGKFAMKFSF